MAIVPLNIGIPRFKANEDRVDIFVNGNDIADVVPSSGAPYPSLRKIVRQTNERIDTLIATKTAEINEGADSALAGSRAARDAARLYANAPEDQELAPGEYSGRHYEIKTRETFESIGNVLEQAEESADRAEEAALSVRYWKGTQAQYDAIPAKDPETLYFIV